MIRFARASVFAEPCSTRGGKGVLALVVIALTGATAGAHVSCEMPLSGDLPPLDQIESSPFVDELSTAATTSRIFRYRPDDRTDLIAKVYFDEDVAAGDARTLAFVKSRVRADDPCRVVPHRFDGTLMWHPYVPGPDLGDFIRNPGVTGLRRAAVRDAYRLHQVRFFRRLRAEFGAEIGIGRRGRVAGVDGEPPVRWFASALRGSARAQHGDCVFIPHVRNVIVRAGDDALILIDPR